MQSEFACHVGLKGNLFCRICLANIGDSSDENSKTGTSANSGCNDNTSDRVSVASVRSSVGEQEKSPGPQINGGMQPDTEQHPSDIHKMSDWVKHAQAFLEVSLKVSHTSHKY